MILPVKQANLVNIRFYGNSNSLSNGRPNQLIRQMKNELANYFVEGHSVGPTAHIDDDINTTVWQLHDIVIIILRCRSDVVNYTIKI